MRTIIYKMSRPATEADKYWTDVLGCVVSGHGLLEKKIVNRMMARGIGRDWAIWMMHRLTNEFRGVIEKEHSDYYGPEHKYVINNYYGPPPPRIAGNPLPDWNGILEEISLLLYTFCHIFTRIRNYPTEKAWDEATKMALKYRDIAYGEHLWCFYGYGV